MLKIESCWGAGLPCWKWLEDWNLIWTALAAIGTWAAAIGTLAAVMVSLISSNQAKKMVIENQLKNKLKTLQLMRAELGRLRGVSERFEILRDPVLRGLKQDRGGVFDILDCRYITEYFQGGGDYPDDFICKVGNVVENAGLLKQRLINVRQLFEVKGLDVDRLYEEVENCSKALKKSVEEINLSMRADG